MKKILDQLQIQAKKNCEECEKYLLTPEDINIDLLFEDWRECSEHCHECKKEDQVLMCEIQFDLMNHLADAVGNITSKINILTKLYLEQDKEGSKFIKGFLKHRNSEKEANKELYQ